LVVVLFGAFCYWLIQIVTASRTQRAEQVATKRRAGYLLLLALFVGQIISLPAAAFLQGLAVSQALQETDLRRALDSELVERIQLYAESPKALSVMKIYCESHIADNEASDGFLSTCVQFNQTPPPTPREAWKLVPALDSDVASD
jgi:hypothetical protein